MMRDLIVKIKTEENDAIAEQVEEDALQLSDSARSAIASDGSEGSRLLLVVSRADDEDEKKRQESLPRVVTLLGESDDSTTSGSFWPDLQVLDPDHPVLERFQSNLSRLLEEEDRQLTLKLIELEEKRKCAVRERKKLAGGVEELKRCAEKSRSALQKEKDTLEAERSRRMELEDRLPDNKKHLEEGLVALRRAQDEANDIERQVQIGRQEVLDMKRRLEEQQLQLAAARGQLDQGQRHRDSGQSNKLFQDLIINELLSDVESTEWRRDQADASLLEEEQLVAKLRDAIRSAHTEISAINAEKIRLNQSWQSSLLVLQRSNETLAATRQSIRDEESRREEMFRCWALAEKEAAELSSKRTAIQLELGRLERRTAERESQYETSQSVKLQHDQRNRRLHFMILAREQELATLIKETELLTKDESDLLGRLEAARTKRKKLQSNLVDQVFKNFACDQEGQAIYRHIRTTEEASRQLDGQMACVESRNGRLMLDLEQLERDLAAQNRLLEEKESLVKDKDSEQVSLDLELAERRKLLERKEAQLVRYRSTLEELIATSLELNKFRSEEERVLKSLQDQVKQCRNETESIQRQWSDAGLLLLSVAMARDQQAVEEDKLRQEVSVWEEKKKRLLKQVANSKQSLAQIHRSMTGWRETLQALDTKLATTSASKEELERWNLLSQSQWQLHLEEPEREVHRLGCQLEQLRCQKSNLEISLCDMAKVAVLWSCKLAEIREAQNYVQAERSDAGSLAILEAEKHRLQVQEVQLKKEQEILNHQLQKAVLGRSGLNVKADLKAGIGHKTRTIRQPIDCNPWHKLLSKANAQRNKEIQAIRRSIDARSQEADRLEAERQSLRTLMQTERERLEILERQISQTATAKRQAVAELTSQQKWWRFYEQLRRGSYRRRYPDDSLSDLEARANQRIASLADVTTRLTEDFPDLKAKLVEVRASLNF